MTVSVGTIGLSTPQEIATRAIHWADEANDAPQTKFALHLGPRQKVMVSRVKRRVEPDGWIATFTKRADPDWLASEIQGASNGAG